MLARLAGMTLEVEGFEVKAGHREPEGKGVEVTTSYGASGDRRLDVPGVLVPGNHDIWVNDGRDVKGAFSRYRIPVLVNKALRLSKDGRPFWLAVLPPVSAYRFTPSML